MVRRYLDVAVFQPVIELVLDAQVGKVDLVVELRQVMFQRPLANFIGCSIGMAGVVVTVLVALVEPLLVLTLGLVVEDDAFDACAARLQALCVSFVGAIDLASCSSSRSRFTPL